MSPTDDTVRRYSDYSGDIHESAEIAVVGSGPGGAVVAHELASRGHDVVLIEEGPPFTPQDFELEGGLSMTRTLREAGLRTTRGTIMPTMQAIALGGGSLVNSAICVRAPSRTLDRWCGEFNLPHTSREDLDPHYDAVEAFLGIQATPDEAQGERNLLFRKACNALGYSSEPIARNVRGCRGSGECFTGCRSRAKQSTDISYVPAAMAAGCRVLTSLQVRHVCHEERLVSGVEGRVVEPFSGRPSHSFRIEADLVVLAAGVMATPVILRRSANLANRSQQVGRNLQFHPGLGVMGIFPEPTHPQFGATQGYQSLQFVQEGFKLETLWGPPALMAVRMPGFGFDLKAHLAEIPYAAIWDGFVSCEYSSGSVHARRGTLNPRLTWKLHPHDTKTFQTVLWTLAELFFAAGARKILPGVHGIAPEIHSLDEARPLRDGRIRDHDLVCAGNHAFSSTRMHGQPHQGVVDENGRSHDIENLYIADTGVFPRSPSVNPMLTCLALAHRTAQRIHEQLG